MCLCALVPMATLAQVWLGGEMGVSLSNPTLGSHDMGSNNSVTLTPEAGLPLGEQWAVALRIGFTHHDNSEVMLAGQTAYGNSNRLSLEPFARYTFWQKGNFRFFVDGGLHFSSLSISNYEHPLYSLGVGISPGLRMVISNRFGLTGHLGSMGYDHPWMKERGMTLQDNHFFFNLFDDISLGAYCNL